LRPDKTALQNSFIQAISIAPLQINYYSEALLTQHARILCRSFMSKCHGNSEWRTCPRSLYTSLYSGERRQIYQWATTPHNWPNNMQKASFLIWETQGCSD